MPTKRRMSKTRKTRITPAAVKRWREVRPWGIDDGYILDDELGTLVGIPALLGWWRDELDILRQDLEEAVNAR